MQRIESAIMPIGYRIPRQKIVVNLTPDDIHKEVPSYTLSIAIGILAASNHINSEEIEKYIILGKLSLDGAIQPIKVALPIAVQAKKDELAVLSSHLRMPRRQP